jgi:hypothetical protein
MMRSKARRRSSVKDSSEQAKSAHHCAAGTVSRMCLLSPITLQARDSMPPGLDGFASSQHVFVHILACSHV